RCPRSDQQRNEASCSVVVIRCIGVVGGSRSIVVRRRWRRLLLAEKEELLAALFVRRSGAVSVGQDFIDGVFLYRGCVNVSGLDQDVAVLTERTEIGAQRRRHFFAIKFIGDFFVDLDFGLKAGLIVRGDLQQKKTVLGRHDVGYAIALQFEDDVGHIG